MVRNLILFIFHCFLIPNLPAQGLAIHPAGDAVIQSCIYPDEEVKILTLTWNGGLKIKKIPIPGGYYTVTQLCTTEIDSVIRNGNVGFKHSKVGKIKDCFYQHQIRNDTLAAIVIVTEDAKNTKLAIEQANLQFGNYSETTEEDLIIYNWKLLKNNSTTNCTLCISADRSKGVMTIYKNDTTEN